MPPPSLSAFVDALGKAQDALTGNTQIVYKQQKRLLSLEQTFRRSGKTSEYFGNEMKKQRQEIIASIKAQKKMSEQLDKVVKSTERAAAGVGSFKDNIKALGAATSKIISIGGKYSATLGAQALTLQN